MHGMKAKSVSPVADRFCGKTYQKESLTVMINNSTTIIYRNNYLYYQLQEQLPLTSNH